MAMASCNNFLLRLFARNTVPCTTHMQVRHRRYRDQHPEQQISQEVLQDHRTGAYTKEHYPTQQWKKEDLEAARRYRFVHPEFLPDHNPELRDEIKERLERDDMMKRRAHLDIPEFYVGSLMAVTLSDPYAEGFSSRFVGICIQRTDTGLRHNFTLRNIIDGHGVEIMYELYNPTIQKIEMLKLEKRLDEELLYLRDAPAQYSMVPSDLEPTPHPKGAPVPINPLKVRLNPRPWKERWERLELLGVEGVEDMVKPSMLERAKNKAVTRPWEKYDLLKKYRETVPLEDQDQAYLHFAQQQKKLEQRKVESLDEQLRKGKQD